MSELEQIPAEEVMTRILVDTPLLRHRKLERGCDHKLIRFPVFQFSIDYLCKSCYGYHERSFSSVAAMAIADIDQLIADEFGGTVVAEVTFGKAEATT